MRGPGPLSSEEAKLSLQLMAEERSGWLQRQRAYDLRAIEDAKWAAATQAAQ